MKAVGKQCAGKPQALIDEGVLGNARTLLYHQRKGRPKTFEVLYNIINRLGYYLQIIYIT